jgi:hypothetical protein
LLAISIISSHVALYPTIPFKAVEMVGWDWTNLAVFDNSDAAVAFARNIEKQIRIRGASVLVALGVLLSKSSNGSSIISENKCFDFYEKSSSTFLQLEEDYNFPF